MNAALWIISGLLATVSRVPVGYKLFIPRERLGREASQDQGLQLRASVRRDRVKRTASSRRALF
jgi:hypothetical protein